MPGLATRGEMENYLFRNRLTDVRYADNTDKVLRSSRRMYRLARAYLPFDRLLNRLKVSSDENITGDMASVSQYYFFRDNIGTHSLFYARKPPNA